MPRYYDLIITDPSAPSGSTPYRRWTTNPPAGSVIVPSTPTQQQTVYDPGALNILFDFEVKRYDTPAGGVPMAIEGVPLTDLMQPQQFAGKQVSLAAGMTAGLPLCNPQQAGVILIGQIYQAWGNWVGTEMTLEFVVTASTYSPSSVGNFSFVWKAGTQLSQAIASTLNITFPNVKQNISISSNLSLSYDEVGVYSTLQSFAGAIMGMTVNSLYNGYPGVSITIQAGQIFVFDGTAQPQPKQIVFTDLVGQPTWINPNQMQLRAIMRADIQVSDIIQMPQNLQNAPGIVTTTSQSLPSGYNYQTTFQGNFTVQSVRHVGNLRMPDGNAWITIITCAPVTASP